MSVKQKRHTRILASLWYLRMRMDEDGVQKVLKLGRSPPDGVTKCKTLIAVVFSDP